MDFAGSKTETNLMIAFLWESQERNRFSIYANIAEKEGYHKISKSLQIISDQERIHSKNFNKALSASELEVTAVLLPAIIKSTEENLQSLLYGKTEKSILMFEEFAGIARRDGFEDTARLFLNILVSEKTHKFILEKYLKSLENGNLWKHESEVKWYCSKCAFLIESEEPPVICPACTHPKEYFHIFNENL